MRFLLIVVLAFLLVRLVVSCDNNGRTKTAATAKSQPAVRVVEVKR